jgi:hypothetical protein
MKTTQRLKEKPTDSTSQFLQSLKDLGSAFALSLMGRHKTDGSPAEYKRADWAVDNHNGAASKFQFYRSLIEEEGAQPHYIDRLLKSFVRMFNEHTAMIDPAKQLPAGFENARKANGLRLKFHGPAEGIFRINDDGDLEVLDSIQISPRLQMKIEGVNQARWALLSKPTAPATEKITHTESPDFKYSQDYRTVVIRGRKFCLTPNRARIIEKLHFNYNQGTPEISQVSLLENSSRLVDSFKTDKEAYRALIAKGNRKGMVKLNLSEAKTAANTTLKQ